MKKTITSESVTKGHPDKLCDLISDTILTEYLKKDKYSRVAIETVASKKYILVTGEVTSKANIDIIKCVKKAVDNAGYKDEIDLNEWEVKVLISKQSSDIALGVDEGKEKDLGAGDQGIVYGYACNDTKEYMPLSISLSHKLSERLTYVREKKIIPFLKSDGKTEVSIEYEDDKPVRISSVVVSSCHMENVSIKEVRKEIKEKVIDCVLPKELVDSNTKYYINQTGRFVIGGPIADVGLTGRKIIVDTYGGVGHHGGGAFSGKDPTKVDRSGAYMARFLAKNIVANGYAKRCEVALSFAIGVSNPVDINIECFGTNVVPVASLYEKINNISLSIGDIIDYLGLRDIDYTLTTNYGHFGKDYLPWERIIKL